MKISRLNDAIEIEEFLQQLEKAQFIFTLLAAGQIKAVDMQQELLEDLAILAILKQELKEQKNELDAEKTEPAAGDCCSQNDKKIQELYSELDELNNNHEILLKKYTKLLEESVLKVKPKMQVIQIHT